MNERQASQPREAARRGGAPHPSTRMHALAEDYPELASFTPDATLLEVKVMYGLGNLEEVRELGRRRAARESRGSGARRGGTARRVVSHERASASTRSRQA